MTMNQAGIILVVDDEEGMRFTLNHYLVQAGYRVRLAADIEEAEAMLGEDEFDAAIIDRVLSNGQNGILLIKTIHERQPLCKTILVSAWPTFSSAADALRYQPFAYLAKPIVKNELLETTDRAMLSGREQRMLHASLRKQRRMDVVNAMAPGMIHDFKNLLTVMDGYADLLKHESGSGDDVRGRIDALTGAILRGRNLIDRMMHEPRSLSLQPEEFELTAVLRDVMKLVRASVRNSAIALTIRAHVDNSRMVGDPDRIFHAILNVCINAIQAMNGSGGELTVILEQATAEEAAASGLSMPGEFLKLIVRDTGPGIPPAEMDRIFQPFHTGRVAEKGAGLGLFMVDQTIKAHGGSVRAANGKNGGAEIAIFCPRAGIRSL